MRASRRTPRTRRSTAPIRHKPYALPEWGLSIDDPGFVKRICTFLKTRPRTKLAAYYDARPGSPYDLGSKAASRAEYRRCITPLGAKAPCDRPGRRRARSCG